MGKHGLAWRVIAVALMVMVLIASMPAIVFADETEGDIPETEVIEEITQESAEDLLIYEPNEADGTAVEDVKDENSDAAAEAPEETNEQDAAENGESLLRSEQDEAAADASDPVSVSTWDQLRDAVENAEDGAYIQLTGDIVNSSRKIRIYCSGSKYLFGIRRHEDLYDYGLYADLCTLVRSQGG